MQCDNCDLSYKETIGPVGKHILCRTCERAYNLGRDTADRLADAACDLLRSSENRQGCSERHLETYLEEYDPLWSTR